VTLASGETVSLSADECTVTEKDQKVSTVSYLPSVIEPSFGLGRIIYSILEHAMYSRAADEQRKVLRLTPVIAPVKIGLYNVASNMPYQPVFAAIRAAAIRQGLSYNEDTAKASIGRKYARGDEIGIPFAITVDLESCDPAKALVTIRERDTMQQIQVRALSSLYLSSRISPLYLLLILHNPIIMCIIISVYVYDMLFVDTALTSPIFPLFCVCCSFPPAGQGLRGRRGRGRHRPRRHDLGPDLRQVPQVQLH